MNFGNVLERGWAYSSTAGPVLVREKLLRKNSEVVVDFLVTLRKVANFCNANKPQAAKYAGKWMKLPLDTLETAVGIKSS